MVNVKENKKQNIINEVLKANELKAEQYLKNIFEKQLKPYCKTYYGYNDALSSENAIKYITEDDFNFFDIINEDNVFDEVRTLINNLNIKGLTEEDEEVLKEYCLDDWNYNLDELIKNGTYYIRLELHSNEDLIQLNNYKESDAFKGFVSQFGHKKELINTIKETPNDYGTITIPLKIKGSDLEVFKKAWLKGKLKIAAGSEVYIYNSFIGGGTLSPFKLKNDIFIKVGNTQKNKSRLWFGTGKYNVVKIFNEGEHENKKYNYNMRTTYCPTNDFYNKYE